MKDMNPGPTLFLFQADKLYAVFILFLIANIALLPLATIAVSFIKRIIWIDKAILYPIILIFSIVGAFAIDNSGASVVVMLVMGVLGYWLQRKEYPVSPIILGMILGPMLEKNLLSSMIMANGWRLLSARYLWHWLSVSFWLSRCKDAISTVHLAVNPLFSDHPSCGWSAFP